jgi:hypothetical protein
VGTKVVGGSHITRPNNAEWNQGPYNARSGGTAILDNFNSIVQYQCKGRRITKLQMLRADRSHGQQRPQRDPINRIELCSSVKASAKLRPQTLLNIEHCDIGYTWKREHCDQLRKIHESPCPHSPWGHFRSMRTPSSLEV